MKYRFVFKNGGWWLKIGNIDELMNYTTSVKSPVAKGLIDALYSREFGPNVPGQPLAPHASNEGWLVGLHAINKDVGLGVATCELAIQIDTAKVNALSDGNDLYFNPNGGWHYDKKKAYTQWYDSDKLIWPDFKENQIKIERFPAGEHYYAYVGNMQVRDGDTLKWNTYEEAYEHAKQYCED